MVDFVDSINQLKNSAMKGNTRCKKIYKNLDKIIKDFPKSVKSYETHTFGTNLNDPKN